MKKAIYPLLLTGIAALSGCTGKGDQPPADAIKTEDVDRMMRQAPPASGEGGSTPAPPGGTGTSDVDRMMREQQGGAAGGSSGGR